MAIIAINKALKVYDTLSVVGCNEHSSCHDQLTFMMSSGVVDIDFFPTCTLIVKFMATTLKSFPH